MKYSMSWKKMSIHNLFNNISKRINNNKMNLIIMNLKKNKMLLWFNQFKKKLFLFILVLGTIKMNSKWKMNN